MTDKQKNIISKYLTSDRVEKLSEMDFSIISSFIDMILHFRSFHPVVGELCSIPYLKRKPTSDEIKNIEPYVNTNKDKFNLLSNEYASVYDVNYLPNGRKWYVIRQTWFKGMSDSPTHKNIKILESGEKFNGIYNELFDSKVYSIMSLLKLYSDALQEAIQ